MKLSRDVMSQQHSSSGNRGIKLLGVAITIAVLAMVLNIILPRDEPSLVTESTKARPSSVIAPLATPAGFMLQPTGKSQGYSLDKQSAAALPRDDFVFADARGLTLYTFDGDRPGQSNCVGECRESFQPVLAAPGDEPFGEWSIIARANGEQQWALRDRPLYTYIKDVDPGSIAGNSPAQTGAPRLDGAGRPVGGGYRGSFSGELAEPNVIPEGWKVAQFYPITGIELPPGLSVQEVADAAAFSLVDHRLHTLYVNSKPGPIEPDPDWIPLPAPMIAHAFGDFDVLDRNDGIRQWTWRGRGLYRYAGDLAPGYANGTATGENWIVAAVYRLFQPDGVSIEFTLKKGAVLAADGGLTLYRRDGHILQSGGGHNLRRGAPARPAVGRDIGTDPRCREPCADLWRPFLAPADEKGGGFWSVAKREDGAKQWVYQGYALWFHAGDDKPGDMNGHDTYDITVTHDATRMVDVGTPMDGGAALWWSIAVP
jgi:predicted lipoprotein with Yx(FWY)xxD motif